MTISRARQRNRSDLSVGRLAQPSAQAAISISAAPAAGSPATTALKTRLTRTRLSASLELPRQSRAIRFRNRCCGGREPSSKVPSCQRSDIGRRRRERAPRPPELLILRRALNPAKDGWQLGENLHVHPGTDLPACAIPGERWPELWAWSVPNPQKIAEKSKGRRSAALCREAELCSKPQVRFANAPVAPLYRPS